MFGRKKDDISNKNNVYSNNGVGENQLWKILNHSMMKYAQFIDVFSISTFMDSEEENIYNMKKANCNGKAGSKPPVKDK